MDDGEVYLDDDEDARLVGIALGMLADEAPRPAGARRVVRRNDRDLGRDDSRFARQVNVKLAVADFEALHAMAISRDLPTATLARMLLRNAIRESRETSAGSTGSRPAAAAGSAD